MASELPIPDHPLGYTRPAVDKVLTERQCIPENFWKWMQGQTTGVTDDGTPVVYADDLLRYLSQGGLNAPIDD